jgi:nitrogen regulatory protein PII 1
MKMIRAIVRPEKAEEVVDSLAKQGYVALTKWDILGRGKQKGLDVAGIHYDVLPKEMLMMVTRDENVYEIVDIIIESAYTGHFGDGKIFVSPVDEGYTIRTGKKDA